MPKYAGTWPFLIRYFTCSNSAVQLKFFWLSNITSSERIDIDNVPTRRSWHGVGSLQVILNMFAYQVASTPTYVKNKDNHDQV